MASLPPQTSGSQSQRPPSHHNDSFHSTPSSNSNSQPRRSSASKSITSEDSQTVLLNNPPSPIVDEKQKQTATQTPNPSSDEEPRKCWICFADETEDTPSTSVWRSPCPCALTAHESCLLDWVADLEAPTSRKRTGSPTKIQCPQCKRDIIIARPRSYVVEGVNAVERVAGRMVVPGIFATLAGSVFTGCWVHGLTSVYMMFGQDDFKQLMGVNSGEGISGRWGFGLPLIPIVLVLSRTTLADNILPVVPILFFASHVPSGTIGELDLWPPSAAMTFATIPYIRGVYNVMYKHIFADKVQRWIKEVQPRAGETNEEAAGNENENEAGEEDDDEDGDVGFELNLEVEIFEQEEMANARQQRGQLGQQADDQQQNGANHNQNQQPPEPAPAARQNNLIISTSRIADTIIGALCYPAIAATMGALIKIGLPKSWTMHVSGRTRPGLLQTRWGRSVIGGCLFVVMKDTLLLYSRYRIAQDHRKRRVLNYDREKRKVVGR